MIYLDMDGVLVDFVKGFCSTLGYPDPYRSPVPSAHALGDWHIDRVLEREHGRNVSWDCLNNPDFWVDLDWMPDGRKILDCVLGTGEPVSLLTHVFPSYMVAGFQGKARWVQKNVPDIPLIVTTGNKTGYVGRRIDDADHHISSPNDFLVPRPWNSRHQETFDLGELQQWLQKSVPVSSVTNHSGVQAPKIESVPSVTSRILASVGTLIVNPKLASLERTCPNE